jgi:hypothetical protein
MNIINSFKKLLSPILLLVPSLTAIWFIVQTGINTIFDGKNGLAFGKFKIGELSEFSFTLIFIVIFISTAVWCWCYFDYYSAPFIIYVLFGFFPLVYLVARLGLWLYTVPYLASWLIPTIVIEEILHQKLIWERFR